MAQVPRAERVFSTMNSDALPAAARAAASATPATPTFTPDDDGYQSRNASLRLGMQLAAEHRLEVSALTSHVDASTGAGGGMATPGEAAVMGALGAGVADPYADMGLSRNAPCPCGSGQKYKHCHGVAA